MLGAGTIGKKMFLYVFAVLLPLQINQDTSKERMS